MAEAWRVLIADDHPLYRDGVAQTLAERPEFSIVAACGSADEAVTLAVEHRPDLVLLDISMPGGGISAVQRIASRLPSSRIIMLTVSERDEDVLASLDAGAHGYVLKGVGGAELVEIASTVAGGSAFVPPALAARLLKSMQRDDGRSRPADDPLAALTGREVQILEHVAAGRSNKEIARALDLQEKTIKHYMTSILQKLHVRNRVEAALLARDATRRPGPGP